MTNSIHAEFAEPADAAVDAFDCGDDEVNNYFRGRKWFRDGKLSPPMTYQFRATPDEPIVGYAAVAPKSSPHPSDDSGDKAKYLVIYAVGVNSAFRGQLFQQDPKETFAAAIFRFIEAKRPANCVGLSLWVREDNARAIAFYKKMGFTPDPGGSKVRDAAGAKHLTMRKVTP